MLLAATSSLVLAVRIYCITGDTGVVSFKRRDMCSFVSDSSEHYVNSLEVYNAKCGQRRKIIELLQDHLPELIQRTAERTLHKQRPECFGSGSGKTDLEALKLIKRELHKRQHGSRTKLLNRALEPNEYSCRLYEAAIENLPTPLDDHLTEIEICQQTFQEYVEGQKEPIKKFHIVHFLHSLYYIDFELALTHCFENELCGGGAVVCVIDGKDLLYCISKLRKRRQGIVSESYERSEKIIKIANDKGWKHEIYSQEYSIDVTDVFDEKSTEGNLFLDFFTHTLNFRETADKQLLEDLLALIKDNTTVKDGKLLGDKSESLILLYK